MNFFKGLLSASLFGSLIACSPSSNKVTETTAASETLTVDGDHNDHYFFRDSDTGEIHNLEDSNSDPLYFQEKFSYLTGNPIRWTGGVIEWWYNPAGQPAQLNTQDVVNALVASAQKWTQKCNIQFKYQGLTNTSVTLSSCDRKSMADNQQSRAG